MTNDPEKRSGGSEYPVPDYPVPNYSAPSYPTPGYPTSSYPTPGYPTPGYPTPGYPTPGYPTPGYPTPGQYQPPGGAGQYAGNDHQGGQYQGGQYQGGQYQGGQPSVGAAGQYPAYGGFANQYPNYGGPGDQPQPKPKAPIGVTAAFVIFLLAAAASILGVTVLFTDSGGDAIRTQLDAVDLAGSGMTRDQLFSLVRNIAAGITILILALYIFFAFMMRAGRNWARIVLTVLAALSLLSVGSGYSGGGALRWVAPLLSLVAIVCMFLKDSNLFFTESKLYRKRV